MRIYQIILLTFFIVAISFFSCDNTRKREMDNVKIIDKNQLKDSLIEVNINMLLRESDLIDAYVTDNKLDVIRTGTGLRYQILEEGEGDMLKTGSLVTIEYEISLLNGDLIYSSDNDGVKSFVVGRGGVESGLEEAILKLRKNSAAILIIPSHLAHGIVGDGNKIPQRASLVYKLKVIDNKSINNN